MPSKNAIWGRRMIQEQGEWVTMCGSGVGPEDTVLLWIACLISSNSSTTTAYLFRRETSAFYAFLLPDCKCMLAQRCVTEHLPIAARYKCVLGHCSRPFMPFVRLTCFLPIVCSKCLTGQFPSTLDFQVRDDCVRFSTTGKGRGVLLCN